MDKTFSTVLEYISKDYTGFTYLEDTYYGEIFLAKDKKNNLKIIKITNINNMEFSNCNICNDIKGIIKGLKLEVLVDLKVKISIMEYIPNTKTFFEFHKKSLYKIIFKNLVEILIKCKEKYLYNLGLTSHNILVDNNLNVYLTNFEHYFKYPENQYEIIYNEDKDDKHYYKYIKNNLPPEFKEKIFYPEKFCVWNLGIILYELIYKDVFSKIKYEKLKYKNLLKPTQENNLILCCLTKNYIERINLNEILHHEYISRNELL
jgi:serine/threonine protein kinase